jgi:hypothetical protein
VEGGTVKVWGMAVRSESEADEKGQTAASRLRIRQSIRVDSCAIHFDSSLDRFDVHPVIRPKWNTNSDEERENRKWQKGNLAKNRYSES